VTGLSRIGVADSRGATGSRRRGEFHTKTATKISNKSAAPPIIIHGPRSWKGFSMAALFPHRRSGKQCEVVPTLPARSPGNIDGNA
jgi:hypothetical protein